MHIAIYLSESEQVEGRPPKKEESAPVSKKPTQPLHGAPRASRPVRSPYVQARAGESLALPLPALVPRSPHASGRLSLRFGPGDWAGSDRLTGEGKPGARVGVTHQSGASDPRPKLPERCRRMRTRGAAAGLPEALGRSLASWGGGLAALPHASSGGAYRNSHNWAAVGEACWDTAAGFHSNRSKFTQAFDRQERPSCVLCLEDRAPRSAATSPGLKRGEPATCSPIPARFRRVMKPTVGVNTFIYTL